MENAILEFENVKRDVNEIFDKVTGDELSIEECRVLTNKLVFLSSKVDVLTFNVLSDLENNNTKRHKKYQAFNIIQFTLLALSIIKLFVPALFIPTRVISLLIIFNITNVFIYHSKSMKAVNNEKEIAKVFVSESEKLGILLNNCIRFLNKKVELICGIPDAKEISEEKFDEMSQNFNLMFVNNLVTSLIYNNGTVEEMSPSIEEIAVRILQTDLETDERDINVLIKMAQAKVKNELDFTRTLHKNDKKPKKF